MKNNDKIKIVIIIILAILLIILSIALICQNKKIPSTANFTQTEDEIYQEVLTEVLYGEEKYVTHDEAGRRVNTSNKMKEPVNVEGTDGLQIEKIDISSKNNSTIISGTVKNTSTIKQGEQIIKISLKDDSGMEVLEVGVYIEEIEPGEATTFQTTATIDLANVYSYSATI